jgi:hypothetical protein
MVNLYYYLLKIATKKAPATKKIADASPKARFRQLSRRLSRLFSLLYLRQFSFSESLTTANRRGVRFNLVESHRIQNSEFSIQNIARQQLKCLVAHPGCGLDCADTKREAKGRAFPSEFCILASEFCVRIHYCGSHPMAKGGWIPSSHDARVLLG